MKPVEVVTGEMWLAAERTLRRIAELGEAEDVVFTLENLNPRSTTPARRSPAPPTPTPSCGRSTARTCG